MPTRTIRTERLGPAAALAALLLAGGCATTSNTPDPPTPVTPLDIAMVELPPEDVIDVHIARFDADVPTNEQSAEVEQVFTDIRAAESRFVPYTLRRTLQQSGHWGDVRVVPEALPGSELAITGHILESHGQTLTVRIRAQDATGRFWIDREYSETINQARYSVSSDNVEDPFQSLYNRVANDLVAARAELPAAAKREIDEIARLRFAGRLAPDVYGDHLARSSAGRWTPTGQGDPLPGAIDEVRLRDARMVDILDQHYSDFHSRMSVPYGDWRQASQREMQNLRELRRQANTRKALGALAILGGIIGAVEADGDLGQLASQAAVIGGIYAVASGIDKSSQTAIHVESLRELGRSLDQDLRPRVLDLKDKTVRLTGSAEAQYRQWNEILADMLRERGDPTEIERDAPGLAADAPER